MLDKERAGFKGHELTMLGRPRKSITSFSESRLCALVSDIYTRLPLAENGTQTLPHKGRVWSRHDSITKTPLTTSLWSASKREDFNACKVDGVRTRLERGRCPNLGRGGRRDLA